MRALTGHTIVAAVVVIAVYGVGCLDQKPVPARPAASSFGVIGDIELLAHQGGSSIDDGDDVQAHRQRTPGPEAAPPAWGAESVARGDEGRERPGSAVPESRLRLLVERSLRDVGVDGEGITLEIEGGRVTLKGRVSTKMRRDRVEVTVRSVDAVQDVVNRIEIADEE